MISVTLFVVGGFLLGFVAATLLACAERNPMIDYREGDGPYRPGWRKP